MSFVIDMDASRRERQQPEGLPVINCGEEFLLPAELPLDVFDPFLTEEFDLAGLIRDCIERYKEVGATRGVEGVVVDTLFLRPDLPLTVINAVFRAFEILFGGPEEYARFKSTRPSLPDYAALFKGLYRAYGVGLGEAFASLGSSGDGGETQKQTSNGSTESTSETPSGAPTSLTPEEEMRLLEEGIDPDEFLASGASLPWSTA